MAAYDFPDTAGRPSDGSFTYTAPDGTIYEWNGYAWQVPDSGNPGGGGGGNFEIPTQALPPSGAADGDMFWCTDDGRLYIYYEDDDGTSQWVDASPDNTSEAVDSYWAKSGSTLSPIDTADSVDIGSGNISLNADGSIYTTGYSKFAGIDCYFKTTLANQSISTFRSDVAGVDTKRVEILADGSATFAGNVSVGTDDIQTGNGISLLSAGRVDASRASGTQSVWQGYTYVPNNASASTSPTSVIYADGSAEFAGGIDVASRSTFANGVVVIANDGGMNVKNISQSDGNWSIQTDGSAEFAGYAVWERPGLSTGIDASGISGDAGASRTWFITTSTGSANFTGTVTAPGLFFNLEADDDTKYTATTNEEGEQTLVYNGAVLDVKERIQNVISRMDAIEANEVTDDATDSALLTLVASLSSRLDERDATIAALTTRITTLEIQSNGGN